MTKPATAYAMSVRIGRACSLLCGRDADRRCTIAGVKLCGHHFRLVHRIRRLARAEAQARRNAA